jgi:hypothetical protein
MKLERGKVTLHSWAHKKGEESVKSNKGEEIVDMDSTQLFLTISLPTLCFFLPPKFRLYPYKKVR